MNDILEFLTDGSGWFAAIGGLLSVVATIVGLVAVRRARAQLALSRINVTPPPEHTPRAELRFQMSNAGEQSIFVNSVTIEVEERRPSPRQLIVRPGAGVVVHDVEITLRDGTTSYEVIQQRYSKDNGPRTLGAHETEAFVVGVVSERGWIWRLRVVATWYRVSSSGRVRTTRSEVVEVEYPKAADFL